MCILHEVQNANNICLAKETRSCPTKLLIFLSNSNFSLSSLWLCVYYFLFVTAAITNHTSHTCLMLLLDYTMLYRTKRNLILSFYLFAFVRHFNYYRMQTMLEEQKHLPSSPSPKIFHMTLGNLVFYYNEKMEKPVVHFWLAK